MVACFPLSGRCSVSPFGVGWGGLHIFSVFRVMGGFARCPAVYPLLVCKVLVQWAVRYMSCFITHRLEYIPAFQACPLFLCNLCFFLAQLSCILHLPLPKFRDILHILTNNISFCVIV